MNGAQCSLRLALAENGGLSRRRVCVASERDVARAVRTERSLPLAMKLPRLIRAGGGDSKSNAVLEAVTAQLGCHVLRIVLALQRVT